MRYKEKAALVLYLMDASAVGRLFFVGVMCLFVTRFMDCFFFFDGFGLRMHGIGVCAFPVDIAYPSSALCRVTEYLEGDGNDE